MMELYTDDTVGITIGNPKHGYTVEVLTALSISRAADGSVSSFDHGSQYDYRICTDVNFDLSADETVALVDFFSTFARGDTFAMRLGLDYSEGGYRPQGFFPAGPDRGDSGYFECKLLDINCGGMKFQPWKYFAPTLSFLVVAVPFYVKPTQISEGSFQIGTVEGLRYPQGGINPSETFGFKTLLSRSGAGSTVDRGTSADSFETSFTMDCNHSKAAALVSHLVGACRGNSIPVTVPADSYLFGAKQADSGTFNARLTSPSIKIKHNAFDEFGIDMNLWMAS